MEKDPKKTASSNSHATHSHGTPEGDPTKQAGAEIGSDGAATLQHEKRQSTVREIGQEVKAHVFGTKGFMKLDYFTLFWMFVVGSMFGLAVETLYHFIVFGGLESRAGLVWGPFSPIYGAGAVLLSLFLNRFYHSHNLVIFLIAMVVGSVVEYATSWGMEVFWGAIAWDYTGTFGSIQGRTNFFFGMMWGMLGLVWMRIIMPFMKKVFSRINSKSLPARILTVLMSIFMVVNIVCTCLALSRENERANGVPATNVVQEFCDEVFPDSFMKARFENMTVGPDATKSSSASATDAPTTLVSTAA